MIANQFLFLYQFLRTRIPMSRSQANFNDLWRYFYNSIVASVFALIVIDVINENCLRNRQRTLCTFENIEWIVAHLRQQKTSHRRFPFLRLAESKQKKKMTMGDRVAWKLNKKRNSREHYLVKDKCSFDADQGMLPVHSHRHIFVHSIQLYWSSRSSTIVRTKVICWWSVLDIGLCMKFSQLSKRDLLHLIFQLNAVESDWNRNWERKLTAEVLSVPCYFAVSNRWTKIDFWLFHQSPFFLRVNLVISIMCIMHCESTEEEQWEKSK